MIHCYDSAEFYVSTARLLMATIEATNRAYGSCAFMLTGGRSAERLYNEWAGLPEFQLLKNVDFYFGDERYVPQNHPESNYGLAMRTLFQHGVPKSCTLTGMPTDKFDQTEAATDYEKMLPSRLDVLLLSVGDDGHIASLFPHSIALCETSRRVVSTVGPKSPRDRLTVTPMLIAQVAHVFVMACGPDKADVLLRAQVEPHNFAELPARLVLDAMWLTDSQSVNKIDQGGSSA